MIQRALQPFFEVELTDDERTALAFVSASAIKLAMAGDDDGLQNLVKSALAPFEPDTIARVHLALEALLELPGMDKTAFNPAMAGTQAALSTIPLQELMRLQQEEEARPLKIRESFQQILKDHPHVATNPKSVAQHFRTIAYFAPDIASDPVVAGNVINSLSKLGPGALTHQLVKELRQLQEGINDERQSKIRAVTEAISPFTRLS